MPDNNWTIHNVALKVRPARQHPDRSWPFGYLLIYVLCDSLRSAEKKARVIAGELPYEVIESPENDPIVGAQVGRRHAAHGFEQQFLAAEQSGLQVGVGFFLLKMPVGTDEQDFTAGIGRAV